MGLGLGGKETKVVSEEERAGIILTGRLEPEEGAADEDGVALFRKVFQDDARLGSVHRRRGLR